jgi:hypothetical protein
LFCVEDTSCGGPWVDEVTNFRNELTEANEYWQTLRRRLYGVETTPNYLNQNKKAAIGDFFILPFTVYRLPFTVYRLPFT